MIATFLGPGAESNNEKEENLSGEKNIVVDANPKEEVHEHELTGFKLIFHLI